MFYLISCLFLFVFGSTVFAQNADSVENFDNTENKVVVKNSDYAPLTKSTTNAMLGSLIFPGVGQIYVEHYWRASLFIPAAGYLWYSTISNHNKYKNEQNKLTAIEDKNSHEYLLTRARREAAVDNRDMAVLYLIGVYTLSIIDAYTGAHLYDFNVEQNINFNFTPNLLPTGNIYWKFGINYRF